VIVIYPHEGEYAREAVDPVGDICEWFKIDPAWVRDALGSGDAADDDWVGRGLNHAVASPRVYLLQRWLTRFVATETSPDPLLVEEALLRIVRLALGGSGPVPRSGHTRRTDDVHREIVMSTRAFLATNFTRPLTLAEIGRNVGASPYHLARLFRRHTGWSVHQYLTDLRLRAALGCLDESRATIADIAFDIGFADNSHLTKSFREKFGITPSQFRSGGTELLSTILTA
jgi:AraC-like DNA-binding protein